MIQSRSPEKTNQYSGMRGGLWTLLMSQDSHTQRCSRHMWMCWVWCVWFKFWYCLCTQIELTKVTQGAHPPLSTSSTSFAFFGFLICIDFHRYRCVSKPIIINVSGVNTHLPAILMFTRATFGFDPKPYTWRLRFNSSSLSAVAGDGLQILGQWATMSMINHRCRTRA